MSTDGHSTKCNRNIAENFSHLSRAHERYQRQTDDTRPTSSDTVMVCCSYHGNISSWTQMSTAWRKGGGCGCIHHGVCISCFITTTIAHMANCQDCIYLWLVMVALCNRADHYIFALWFLSSSSFFSSPNLSGRRLDVYHTSDMVWP